MSWWAHLSSHTHTRATDTTFARLRESLATTGNINTYKYICNSLDWNKWRRKKLRSASVHKSLAKVSCVFFRCSFFVGSLCSTLMCVRVCANYVYCVVTMIDHDEFALYSIFKRNHWYVSCTSHTIHSSFTHIAQTHTVDCYDGRRRCCCYFCCFFFF